MNGMEKYLFELRLEALRDTEPLSDADLDALLDSTGCTADPDKQNPEPLSTGGTAEVIGDIVQKWRQSVLALCGMTGMDGSRVIGTFDAMKDFRGMDPMTVLCELVERELGRRGPVARSLTRWLLKNAFSFASIQDANGWGRERLGEGIAEYLEANNAEYARAVRLYFNQEAEDLDTDAKLAASCVILGLPFEDTLERAAILEIDGGMRRTAAAMRAVWLALQKWQARISESTAAALFDLASDALTLEQEHNWRRAQVWDWLMAILGEKQTVERFPNSRAAV